MLGKILLILQDDGAGVDDIMDGVEARRNRKNE